MADKNTLPMDVSRGIQFDFTVEGITEEQAKNLLGLIQDEVNNFGGVMGGGYVSVAHMEELEGEEWNKSQEPGLDWNDFSPDLLDMVDDDISLEDLEGWEEDQDNGEWFSRPDDLSDYEY